MKAAVIARGKGSEGLHVQEVPRPSPGPGEFLIRVKASSVCQGDVKLRRIPRAILAPLGLVFGFKPMAIPGVEFSGVVEEAGASTSRLKPGDAVFGTASGLAYGGNAEFLCVPESRRVGVLARMPEGLGFREAAVLPVGGMTALQNLRRLALGAGSRLLVYGASGSVGSYAVQLARQFGARVTAVCGPANLEALRGLGAEVVLDYNAPHWIDEAGRFDAVIDAVGRLSGPDRRRLLSPLGRFSSVRSPTAEVQSELEYLAGLAVEGRIRPLMDRAYPLERCAEAHDYVEAGHKRGNVVIELDL